MQQFATTGKLIAEVEVAAQQNLGHVGGAPGLRREKVAAPVTRSSSLDR
jgi:hypothetical protein